MNRKINNKNGFTLIELLAVIVIMGVLMMVAIPAMTRYIENAKRDVFADTAKKYISAVRYTMLSDGFTCNMGTSGTGKPISGDCGLTDLEPGGKSIVVPASFIELENATEKSPWGKTFDGRYAWIKISNVGTSEKPEYKYYFVGTDSSKNGITSITEESEISRAVVHKSNSSLATDPCTSTECWYVDALK